jgi:O-antigen/teichoic acid export membrane protein
MPSERQQSLRNIIAGTYGVQLALLPLAFSTSAMQARFVGPAGRGQLATLLAVASLATLYLAFGVNSAITYFIASGKLSASNLRSALTKLITATSIAFAAILTTIVASGRGARVLGSLPLGASAPAALLLFVLLTHNGMTNAILAGRSEFKRVNVTSLTCAIVNAIAYVLLTALGSGSIPPVFAAIGVQLGVETLRAALLGFFAWSSTPEAERARPAVDSPLRMMMSYSLLAYACDTVHYLTYRFDVWIVRNYSGDVALGQYDLAVRLGELVWLLSGAIAAVLFPTVANMEREEAIRTTSRLAVFALLASVVLGSVGWALSIPLLPRIFSEAYRPSIQLLGVLLLGIVPTSVGKVVGNYLAGTGGMRFSLYSAIVGMVCCLTLDLVLIPRYGALGAAIASSITYNIFTILLLFFFKRSTGKSWSTLLSFAHRTADHE